MNSESQDPQFYPREGVAYHGTDIEAARKIVDEQKFNVGNHPRLWYGSGCYLYENGSYEGWESAEMHCRRFKKLADVCVLKATYKSQKCLDLNKHANFGFLTNRIYPLLIEKASKETPELVEKISLSDVLAHWLSADTEIDAVRGTSFEGEVFRGNEKPGKHYPANVLLDVQNILCIKKSEAIQSVDFL